MSSEIAGRPAVARSLGRAADPVLASETIRRLAEAHPEIGKELVEDSLIRDAVIALSAASRSLTSALVADPSLLDPLHDHARFTLEQNAPAYGRSWDLATRERGGSPRQVLRWWKRRELLRIAVRDLLGVADLDAVGRELAGLASTALHAAHDIAAASFDDVRLGIVGMGKLGGTELNYASDVDVLFVHQGDSTRATRFAREVLDVMSVPDDGAIVFRTDADLRPEGRDGPLTRSLDSYLTWYERWAQPWEFQALLKARPVAGDVTLAEELVTATRTFVWPEVLDADAIREIRAMKARSEEETRRRGLADREVKRGRGGIRDVEFSVQLLQLVHGRHDTEIRSPNTLTALSELARAGYVDEEDARRLAGAYRHLRAVEHRLQLRDERQTHTLPEEPDELQRLARILGYRDDQYASASEQFQQAHTRHQSIVREIHERLYFAPLLDAIAGVGPLTTGAIEERLAAFGFTDVGATEAALKELTAGLTRRSRLMEQVLPVVLQWCSDTPDPDLALLQLRRLTDGPTRATAFVEVLRDTPFAAQRVCRILGSSRMIGDALLRRPDFLDELADEQALAAPRPVEAVQAEALETLRWRDDASHRHDGLRRFKRRELLRVAARDLLGFATVETTGAELGTIADGVIEAALRCLDPEVPFAVIAMGRFGGRELSYASDLDVLFVFDGEGPEAFARAEHTATALIQEISATTSEGQAFAMDADLRPEGKQGPLARSLTGFRRYYEQWVMTWERQAMLRARVVAGDRDVGQRLLELVEPHVYRDPLTDDDVREIRRMKVRVEQERIPPGEDPQFHLKLGRGSLSDVEWTVQLLQLRHGATDPSVRNPSTIGGLHALRRAGYLSEDDADALEAAYRYCERARNARYLLTGAPGDSLPTDARVAERLGRLLGYVHRPQTSLREDYRRLTRRARDVVERVFYEKA